LEEIIFYLKCRLPYTFAFVLETIRYSCALPIIAPRMATEDINLDSFHIKAVPEKCFFSFIKLVHNIIYDNVVMMWEAHSW